MTHHGMLGYASLIYVMMISVLADPATAKGGRYLDPWRLPPGSEQHQLLSAHEEFLRRIKGCCNLFVDGRAALEQEDNDDSDKDQYPYIVWIDHDLSGNRLKEPYKLKIPKSAVVDYVQALRNCEGVQLKMEKNTCTAPFFNVIWYHDNSSNKTYVANSTPYEVIKIFCFFPAIKVQ